MENDTAMNILQLGEEKGAPMAKLKMFRINELLDENNINESFYYIKTDGDAFYKEKIKMSFIPEEPIINGELKLFVAEFGFKDYESKIQFMMQFPNHFEKEIMDYFTL